MVIYIWWNYAMSNVIGVAVGENEYTRFIFVRLLLFHTFTTFISLLGCFFGIIECFTVIRYNVHLVQRLLGLLQNHLVCFKLHCKHLYYVQSIIVVSLWIYLIINIEYEGFDFSMEHFWCPVGIHTKCIYHGDSQVNPLITFDWRLLLVFKSDMKTM